MNRINLNYNLKFRRDINRHVHEVDTGMNTFQEILNKSITARNLKFSKHAIERLKNRNINLTQSEIDKLNDAVKKASSKGIREALILMDNKAFIASVKNNTIITAAVDEQLRENIFTNIDGAVIV
ncbi:flagellar operon protein [Caminicella sporogenes DSM 14501]|uniref:Flagellar operon protein n=1 Tax=Caminicella sporogenes DSM 14501 TaxID=1121266 RepID=A0A1M6LC28_9FIRM|nr:TIGR02530 family flagellar biosynthesis protein [Caminicella sporogenes]RKD27783.1 flagellar protein [Caminicella sporogenes]SHJ68790.1 flagellar operon protein [Caminicella sporogenes DSM 14501]